jgi:hypothetical protein
LLHGVTSRFNDCKRDLGVAVLEQGNLCFIRAELGAGKKEYFNGSQAFRCSWWVRANRIFKTEGLSAMVSARSTADDRPPFPEIIRTRPQY